MSEFDAPLYKELSPLGNGEPYRIGDWRKVPEIIHDDEQIKGFFGEYRWLSNFGHASVVLDGFEYRSTEIAYQAAKWKSEDRAYFETCNNEESIAYNQERSPNKYTGEEWDTIKVDVMHFLLIQKFDPARNPENAIKLLGTDNRYIEETNWWNDTFWGKNLAGEGENNLGRLLMKVRTDLQSL